MDTVPLPVKQIGKNKWILLNELNDKILFRAFRISKPYQSQDPSDHNAMQVEGKGSPKCCPKKWDIRNFQ
ncbi:MAG: hypothetical protein J4431_04240 [Candidatus Aenigmarchaeota archaeon]|nr:hypothetical protein [Candidatus Aenigmarchaeota archaeon]